MIQELKIALRNLNRQKKRNILLASAIAFGIMIVTLINGFTGAFVENVNENFSHMMAGHVFLEGVEKTTTGRNYYFISDDRLLTETIEELDLPMLFMSKRSEFSGNLVYNGKTLQQNIVGADWAKESYFSDRMMIVSGSFENMKDPDAIILSQEVADRLGLGIGDRMLVRMKTYTGQQNLGEFVLAATVADPGLIGSMSAYANLEYVNQLLNLKPGEYKIMGVYLESLRQVDETADRLYTALEGKVQLFPREKSEEETNYVEAMLQRGQEEEWEGLRYRLYTINDLLSDMKELVNVLDTASLIILLVLFVIIMVGITNTFRMVMLERVREIGTIRALGVQKDGVLRLFLFEALFVGLIGYLSGLAAAGIVMAVLNPIDWGMDTAIFILLKNGHMTFKLLPWQLALNFSVVVLLTLLAAWLPARKAANLEPAHALRVQN